MNNNQYAERRQSVAGELPARKLDCLFLAFSPNLRYLSGFTGSNAALLLNRDGTARLATDGRYEEQAARESPDLALTVTRASWDAHIEVNLRAPFVLMQGFAAQLPDTASGAIMNLLEQRAHLRRIFDVLPDQHRGHDLPRFGRNAPPPR